MDNELVEVEWCSLPHTEMFIQVIKQDSRLTLKRNGSVMSDAGNVVFYDGADGYWYHFNVNQQKLYAVYRNGEQV